MGSMGQIPDAVNVACPFGQMQAAPLAQWPAPVAWPGFAPSVSTLPAGHLGFHPATGLTLAAPHGSIAAQLSPLRHSYPERQRDRPFEASATCPRDQVPEDVVPTPAERRFWKMRGQ